MPAEIRRQRMTVEEYHLLPFHPGWKVEYIHGQAVFWPRETCAYGILPVRSQPGVLVNAIALRALDSTDSAAGDHFPHLFLETFCPPAGVFRRR